MGFTDDPPAPPECLGGATACRHIVQGFRPVAESLEWSLGELEWLREGVRPFVESGVPYVINNTGTLSADVAALVFAGCLEAPPDGAWHILEIGAGTGLFARYFLDEFRTLCERHSRAFYERLTYWATDASPRTVEQWRELDLFGPHSGHVAACASHAMAAPALLPAPVRVALANYVLDVLPAAIVRRKERAWEQLEVQTCLAAETAVLRQFTPLTLDEIRSRAASSDPADLAPLLPLLPLLQTVSRFSPLDASELSRYVVSLDGDSDGGGQAITVNFGAMQCLDALLPKLERGGFAVIHDYAAIAAEAGARGPQRFGPSSAVGLNFKLIERHARAAGFEVLAPNGDESLPVHPRLLLRDSLPEVRRMFEARFSGEVRRRLEDLLEKARREAEAGSLGEAALSFRQCLEENPRDWRLVSEAAVFAAEQLRDYPAALQLIRTALALNPWYDPSLWNLAGDALTAMGRLEDAHECYLQARRIHPNHAGTCLNLARSYLACGHPERCLEAVATGLANDSQAMLRHRLLEQQQRAISDLALRWNAEREAAARRRG